jgi:hypothetical protein
MLTTSQSAHLKVKDIKMLARPSWEGFKVNHTEMLTGPPHLKVKHIEMLAEPPGPSVTETFQISLSVIRLTLDGDDRIADCVGRRRGLPQRHSSHADKDTAVVEIATQTVLISM